MPYAGDSLEDSSPALCTRRCVPACTPPSPPRRTIRQRGTRLERVREHLERLGDGKRPEGFSPSPQPQRRAGLSARSTNPLFMDDDDDDFMPPGQRAYTCSYAGAPATLSGGNVVAHYRKHVLRVPSQEDPGEDSGQLPDSPDARMESPYTTDSEDRKQLAFEQRERARKTAAMAAAQPSMADKHKWMPGPIPFPKSFQPRFDV
jgi:hypothetical protein